MCKFKSFIYNTADQKFYSSDNTNLTYNKDSHSTIIDTWDLCDQKCFKFELIPTNSYKNGQYYWNFRIDTLNKDYINNNIDIVNRCFTLLPGYILSNIDNWTKQGIDNLEIIRTISYKDPSLSLTYNTLEKRSINLRSKIDNELNGYNDPYKLQLKQFKKVLLANGKIKQAAKIDVELNSFKILIDEAQKEYDIILEELKAIESQQIKSYSIETLTLEAITDRVDSVYQEFIK
jgi:hypothetical protein